MTDQIKRISKEAAIDIWKPKNEETLTRSVKQSSKS